MVDGGKVYLQGASQSSATIELIRKHYPTYHSNFIIELDEDGNGIYEQINAMNIDTGETTGFSSDSSPMAVITKSYPDEQEELRVGNSVGFTAEHSHDIDSRNSSLTFIWTLESKPTASQTAIQDYQKDQQSIYLDIDAPGEYQLSLKVTDPDGNTNLAVTTFTIKDHPPIIEFNHYHNNNHIELGEDNSIHVNIDDHEDDWQAIQQYSYAWSLQRPEGSNAFLTNTNRSYAQLSADVPGTYTISYQTTDSTGQTTEETLILTAGNTPPTAVIDMTSTVGNGGVIVGSTIEFNGSQSSDPSTSPHELQFSWALETKPTGSQAQIITS